MKYNDYWLVYQYFDKDTSTLGTLILNNSTLIRPAESWEFLINSIMLS